VEPTYRHTCGRPAPRRNVNHGRFWPGQRGSPASQTACVLAPPLHVFLKPLQHVRSIAEAPRHRPCDAILGLTCGIVPPDPVSSHSGRHAPSEERWLTPSTRGHAVFAQALPLGCWPCSDSVYCRTAAPRPARPAPMSCSPTRRRLPPRPVSPFHHQTRPVRPDPRNWFQQHLPSLPSRATPCARLATFAAGTTRWRIRAPSRPPPHPRWPSGSRPWAR